MSRLEDALAAGRFVVTSELQTVDSGGLDAVHERFAPFEDYVDATNATDNTSAHAHASPLAVAIALKQLGMEPVHAADVPRPEPARRSRRSSRARRCTGSRTSSASPATTSPPATSPRRGASSTSTRSSCSPSAGTMARGTYLSGRRIDPPPKLFLGAVENSRRAAVRLPRRPRAEEGARRRALPAAAGLLPARAARGVPGGGGREGARRAVRAPPLDLPHALARRAALHRRARAGDRGAARADRALRAAPPTPRRSASRSRSSSPQQARSLPGVAGLHLISFRREAGIARLCERLGIPPRAERETSGHRRPVAV